MDLTFNASVGSIISIILLFADGLIFGIAAKKGVTSAILIIVGLILAGAIGLTIPFISVNDVITHVYDIFLSQAARVGGIVYSFPVFWIVGFAIGLWRG